MKINFDEKLFDIFQKKGADENFLISPYSIRTALAMLREGAYGRTKEEMDKVLGVNPPNLEIDTLEVANAIWLLTEPNSEWLDLVERKYNATAENLKGYRSPKKRINDWTSEKTHGKITKIIDKILPRDRMVLTNAIYFKDDWLFQFDKDDTRKDDFFVSDGETVKADFMHQTRKFQYAETDNLQILELPYSDLKISMMIFLPKSGEEVPLDTLSYVHQFNRKTVNVYLPKFKIEKSYKLKEVLRELGIIEAFSDFAKFDVVDEDEEAVKIDSVLHKTFVDVDEEGTEAAAVTAVKMRALSAFHPPNPPVEFKADHPFVFVIREKRTNTNLFVGKVKTPS